ncbi:sensor histidine kinase [Chitinophaga lutea]
MKLLNKTVQRYFLFSVILLLVAIPIFYWVLNRIVIANVDTRLIATKTQLIPQLRMMQVKPGERLPEMGDVTIERAAPSHRGDSLYTADAYRLLSSRLEINRETYHIQIRSSLANHQKLIASIIILQATLLICLLAGLLLINRGLSRKIWAPFFKTLEKLRHYKVDQPAPLALGGSSVSEFAELNTAVEQLAERSRQAFISQKEFAENASHELRTPLAVFQSKLELLMQTDPLTEEQAVLITDLLSASRRMARLNKGLVLLTRIQNGQFPDTEPVSIKASVQHLLGQYRPQLDQQRLTLQEDWHDDITVSANPTLIEVLLGNLLANAVRHNVPGGNVLVRLRDGILTIQNTGRQQALDGERIFRRFARDSRDEESMGLGLEIVRKIADLYGFEVTYAYEHPLHTFRLDLQGKHRDK